MAETPRQTSWSGGSDRDAGGERLAETVRRSDEPSATGDVAASEIVDREVVDREHDMPDPPGL